MNLKWLFNWQWMAFVLAFLVGFALGNNTNDPLVQPNIVNCTDKYFLLHHKRECKAVFHIFNYLMLSQLPVDTD